MQPRRQNNQSAGNVGIMIQRCHKYRQRRKQYMDQARQTPDEVERERLMQMAEHFGRIVNSEQGKIDNTRGPAVDRFFPAENDEEEDQIPDFANNL